MSEESIVIAGIPSCGKTVLLSVLALRRDLLPKSAAAQDFRDRADVLAQGEWPPPTNPLEQKTPMVWDLNRADRNYRLWNCDVSGEEWYTFIRENMSPDEASKASGGLLGKLRSQLKKEELGRLEDLETQLKCASGLCLLIDLAEDLNTGRNRMQCNFVEAVTIYLEKVGRTKCPLALVVTKCKTYGPESVWRPLLDRNYKEILKRWKGKVSILYTDAVADTVANEEGKLVPAENFSSVGLPELLKWIAQTSQREQQKKKLKQNIIGGLFFLLFCLVIGGVKSYFEHLDTVEKNTTVYMTRIELSNIPEFDTIGRADLRIYIRPSGYLVAKEDWCKKNYIKYCEEKIQKGNVLDIRDADGLSSENEIEENMARISLSPIFNETFRNYRDSGILEGNAQTIKGPMHYKISYKRVRK